MLPEQRNTWNVDKNGSWWTDPPDGSLPFEFCRDTTLHGLKYLEQPRRHLSERIFWLLAFLTGLIVAAVLIIDMWRNFRDKPIIVSFAPFETTIDDIPFPAVTICNMNKVLKTNVVSIMKNLEDADVSSPENLKKAYEDVYLLNHICSESSGFSRVFNFSLRKGTVDEDLLAKYDDMMNKNASFNVEEFLRSASQSCSQMIALCLWGGDLYDCKDLFNPIETRFGKCCTFNMVPQTLFHRFRNDSRDDEAEVAEWAKWNVENDGFIFTGEKANRRRYPRRQGRSGKTYGLSILLDPNLDEYFCTTSDAMGFRMATHLSTDFPHVADFGISIEPNKEVFVNVKAEITIAEDSIHDFPLEKRLCYFPLDYPLTYYKYYTTANCVEEAVARDTLENCSCVRYYMPRDNETKLCGPKDVNCAENIKKNYNSGHLSASGMKCYPLCTEIQYSTTVTSTRIQNDGGSWQFPNASFARWRYNNVSILHVYFGQPSTTPRMRKQFLSSVDLIAQTGGIMGLCLGFSGLSLIEFIYYFTMRLWWQTRWKENFGSKVLQTVAGAWQKTKHFAHINGVNSLAIPNVREITKGQTIERQRRGMWSQHEMIQQINAALASRRHLVDNRMEEDISQRDEASGAVLYDEMSPYYRISPRRTQYWNPNA